MGADWLCIGCLRLVVRRKAGKFKQGTFILHEPVDSHIPIDASLWYHTYVLKKVSQTSAIELDVKCSIGAGREGCFKVVRGHFGPNKGHLFSLLDDRGNGSAPILPH